MNRDAHRVIAAQVGAGPPEDEPLNAADALLDGLLDHRLDAPDIRLGQVHMRNLMTQMEEKLRIRESVILDIVISVDDDRARQEALPEIGDLFADGLDLLSRYVCFVDARAILPERRARSAAGLADFRLFGQQQRRRLDVAMTKGRPEALLLEVLVFGQRRDEPRHFSSVPMVEAEEYGSLRHRLEDLGLRTENGLPRLRLQLECHGSNMTHSA
ncbi:hypothetical protein CWO91_27920 [Bradyrhizobium genosp. SA-3]|uniref:hypothetical protein n=1 Tax=Bradyrhizobium genosp. SA-3 TaxID=508868 RepID=UPI00102912FD|nr:hypothetical protein [Bradyrhizobium genosp. SA-3]RZN07305.1 hypothetical protein CWO91_27920 [Bradyrhizobium genosp. SA-3]